MSTIVQSVNQQRTYFLLALLCGGLFLMLAYIVVVYPSLVHPIDSAAHALVVPLETHFFLQDFLVITAFGNTSSIVVGALLMIAVFWRKRALLIRMAIALIGVTASATYFKAFVHRARPDTLQWLLTASTYSFPSGHSDGSMVFYSFVGILLYCSARTKMGKILAIVLPGILIFLIGLSRIVLNYHYFSDVVGGYLLGAFWVFLSLSLSVPWRQAKKSS